MKQFSILLLLLLALSSCTKYGFVNLKYPTAPDVALPDNINKIAMIARTIPPQEKKTESVVESIITGEILGSDKTASVECLNGFANKLNGFRNYAMVMPQKPRRVGSANRITPDLMDWNAVKEICDSTDADALLVLETFDSNSNLLGDVVNREINAVLSTGSLKPTGPMQVRMNINSYWRMYDPINQAILDQFHYTHYLDFNLSGPLNVPPPDALPKTAFASGEQYANRFFPGFYWVKRDMYKRGKGRYKTQFLAGFRRSEVADWNGAYTVWLEIANNARGRKNAGRACVDLAVACEVLEKYQEALDWANKSYEYYGNKMGRDYANILRRRIN